MPMMEKGPPMDMEDAVYQEPKSPEAEPETTSVDEEAAENPTALIPLSALGGKVKEGDSVTVRVVKVYGDEAEVEISAAAKLTTEPMSADDELDAMETESEED